MSLTVTPTMTAVEQWQWFLSLRRRTLFARHEHVHVPTHGTTYEYSLGCRCERCTEAVRESNATYRKTQMATDPVTYRAKNAARHKQWADANRDHLRAYKREWMRRKRAEQRGGGGRSPE